MEQDMEKIRLELLNLSKTKEIPYSQQKVRKMGYTELEQIYNEYKAKELDHLNETFADILIVKFDEILKNYNWIKQESKLGQKLQDRKLFKSDLKTLVSYFTPLLPFLGLIEGSAVVVSEVVDNYNNNKENEDTSRETTQGGQHHQTATESVSNDKHDES